MTQEGMGRQEIVRASANAFAIADANAFAHADANAIVLL